MNVQTAIGTITNSLSQFSTICFDGPDNDPNYDYMTCTYITPPVTASEVITGLLVGAVFIALTIVLIRILTKPSKLAAKKKSASKRK